MKTFTKALVGATLALSVSVGFAYAASLTSEQVTAIMNLLQSFGADQSVINNVQASLTGGKPTLGGDDYKFTPGMGSTTKPMDDNGQREGAKACLTFARNLSQGSQGDDVKNLQQMLSDEGEFTASTTGFFGPVTAKALAMWQEHNGIASSTNGGSFGSLTRGFLQRRCGAGMGDNGKGNGGIPGVGGMMGSSTSGHPMFVPPSATTEH